MGYVYFLEAEEVEAVLISATRKKNLIDVISNVQKMWAFDLKLIGSIETEHHTELKKAIRSKFDKYKLQNGWFNLCAEDIHEILNDNDGHKIMINNIKKYNQYQSKHSFHESHKDLIKIIMKSDELFDNFVHSSSFRNYLAENYHPEITSKRIAMVLKHMESINLISYKRKKSNGQRLILINRKTQ